jgi:hypothetical protein
MEPHNPLVAQLGSRGAPLVSHEGARRMGNGPARVLAGSLLLLAACQEVPRTYSTRAKGGEVIFRDTFDRDELGPSWNPTGQGFRLANGVLEVRDLKNHPIWLTLPLPDDVRIEFDAWPQSEEGDVKVELAGDGVSKATSLNYVASGYVIIFGGWNNSLNAIARQNEHGRDRETTSDPKALPDRRHHFSITRYGGEILWEVDGREVLVYDDPHPLRGEGHRHFAFSGWEAEVHFDNLVIEAL